MNQEVALLYNLSEDRLQKVRGVLMFLGIRLRVVTTEEYALKVGDLAAGAVVEADTWQGDAFAEEMMVLRLPPARVNGVIQRFQRHKVALPTLTAVLTETNAQWDSVTLACELRREREAIMQGKKEH